MHVFVNIYQLPFGQLATSGFAIQFPVQAAQLVQQLPRPRNDTGTLIIRVPAPARPAPAAGDDRDGGGSDDEPPPAPRPRSFQVNRQRVDAALSWLLRNNVLYRQVQVRALTQEEVAAAAAEELEPAAAEEPQLAHAVAMDEDPRMRMDALERGLEGGQGGHQERGLVDPEFVLERSTGRPASILQQRELEVGRSSRLRAPNGYTQHSIPPARPSSP